MKVTTILHIVLMLIMIMKMMVTMTGRFDVEFSGCTHINKIAIFYFSIY